MQWTVGKSELDKPAVSPTTIRANPVRASGFRWALQWQTFLLLVLIWTPAAIAGLYCKWAILRWETYVKIALSLGRQGLSNASMDASPLFTWAEKLSFFRADLLFDFVIVPSLLLLLSVLPGKKLIAGLVALIAVAWIAVINVQLEAFRTIGNFQSWDLMKDALQWAWENTIQAKAYVAGMAVARTVLLISLVASAILWTWGVHRGSISRTWIQRTRNATTVLWVLSIGITGVAWLPWIPPTAGHSSVQLATVAALPDSPSSSKLSSLPRSELERRYRQLAQVPLRSSPAYWASARDYDVVFYIFETTPQQCVAFDDRIEDLPNIRRLREQAWVGARHYTPYPVTSRALFSLLTSMYPPDNSKDNVRFKDNIAGGMIRHLTNSGYQTAVYGSSASLGPWAKPVFENLGFRHIVQTDGGPGSSAWARLGISGVVDPAVDLQSYIKYQQRLDLLALDALKNDIQRWTGDNQRFAAVYLPQISHAPWGDPRSDGREANLIARCPALVGVQDGWLGDLLNFLDKRSRLSRTLIVVAGDHGIRSPVEDPAFKAGASDSYTFQVPFLLYAPAVLHSTHVIPWVTSHIDVASSVLDLLGISRNIDDEQGGDIWDERLAQRNTYFLSNLLNGVDGYYARGKFYSWNRVLDVSYQNEQLHFEAEHVVPARSPLHDEIANQIRAFDQLRSALFRAASR